MVSVRDQFETSTWVVVLVEVVVVVAVLVEAVGADTSALI
jgi:hypothetical protein